MKIIVQNLFTEYEESGSGKLILFLHGWKDNLRTFDRLVPFLSSAHKVIRVDLPGFGMSETPKEAWCLDDYVLFVKNFIDKLNIKVDIFLGHSFGGRIIIKGVAEKKFDPERIILIASAGVTVKKKWRRKILKILVKIGRWVTLVPPLVFWRNKLRRKTYNLAGSDYLDAGLLKKTFLRIISEDLSLSSAKISTPTLLIWGDDDTLTPLADGQKLSRLIRDSRLKVITGTGHFIHQEKPEEVSNFIKEFL